MSIAVFWQVENRVIYVEVQGDVPIEDVWTSTEEITKLLDSGQRPVHLLADMRQMGKIPTQVNQMRLANQAVMQHPALGQVFGIGSMNPIVQLLAAVITQVARVEYRSVSSPEEAMRILERTDLTLAEAAG